MFRFIVKNLVVYFIASMVAFIVLDFIFGSYRDMIENILRSVVFSVLVTCYEVYKKKRNNN